MSEDLHMADGLTLSNIFTTNGKLSDLHKNSRPQIMTTIAIGLLDKPTRTTTDELRFIISAIFNMPIKLESAKEFDKMLNVFSQITNTTEETFQKLLTGNEEITKDLDTAFRINLLRWKQSQTTGLMEIFMAKNIVNFVCVQSINAKYLPKIHPKMYTLNVNLKIPLYADKNMIERGIWEK